MAMLRGSSFFWTLYDGSPGHAVAHFTGNYAQAHTDAAAWCSENGYYLSSDSDADDRVPMTDCTCLRYPYEYGCPVHWPRRTVVA